MVAAFFALTHSIERGPSTSSSQTKGSSEGCCAATCSRGKSESASKGRRTRVFMRAPGDSVPDGVLRCGYRFRKRALAGRSEERRVGKEGRERRRTEQA